MQIVMSYENFYVAEEMASVFDIEKLETKFGELIRANMLSRLNF